MKTNMSVTGQIYDYNSSNNNAKNIQQQSTLK